MSVVPLADVKAHLNLNTTANDDEVAGFIAAAESSIAKRLGALAPTVVTRMLYRSGSVVVLPDRHILTGTGSTGDVYTATYEDVYGGTGALDPSALWIDQSGLLHWAHAVPNGWVSVTYTVGFDPLPADVKHGVLEMVRHLWTTQRGNATSGGARADMLGVAGEPTTAAGMAAYSLPNRVKELLAPYMPQTSIA